MKKSIFSALYKQTIILLLLGSKKEESESDSVPDYMKHLSAKQVMKLLPCSKDKLAQLRREGKIIAFPKGRFSYTYPPEQFTAEFIKRRKEEEDAKSKLALKKGKQTLPNTS